ncbi:hypothetical protein ABIB06_006573 [Bradyrhizobium sp. LB8.2]|uniref:hypothetical protein n=1 Tax=unclassified Bradyrhizobium TaxID=2631580 RepID=UPI0033939E73
MSRSKRDYEHHMDAVQALPGYEEWLEEHQRQVTDEDLQRMYEQQYEGRRNG